MSINLRYLPLAALATALILGGCHSSAPPSDSSQDGSSPADQQQSSAKAPKDRDREHDKGRAPVHPPAEVVELPAGTSIRVRLDQDLSSKDSQPGETFPATVADDVTVNGQVVIPRDSRADGTVVDAKPLGKFKGGALLAVKLNRVQTKWGSYTVDTGAISRAEQGKGKRSVGFIGGGAGLGALIGGLAGGGKGAAIGALAGGGAGTAGAAFTGNKQIVLPAETLLTFQLQQSVRITEHGNGGDQSGDPQLQPR